MSCSLFDDADDVADAFCRIVFQQYMDVVFACLHSDNCPVALLCEIAYGTLYKAVDAVLQQCFSILFHKYDMYFEIVFASVSAIVAVLRKFSSSYCIFTKPML